MKNPRLPGEGPGFRWSVRLAALVPRPSVPPGAGNKAKKAGKGEPKRVEQGAEHHVETGRLDRHLDTSAIRRHDDGNGSAIPTIQIEQQRPPREALPRPSRDVRAV
jgi:hypothetical protein